MSNYQKRTLYIRIFISRLADWMCTRLGDLDTFWICWGWLWFWSFSYSTHVDFNYNFVVNWRW